MNRRAFIVGSSLAGLAACARPASGDLRLSIVAVSQELDPYAAPNLESAELSWLYADGLAGSDPAAPERGSLCVAPAVRSIAGDAASFAYELRPGIRWHDGAPLVAKDVALCFDRVRASGWGTQRPFSSVERIEVRDARRFNVHLKHDDPHFAAAFFTPFGSPGVPLVRPGRLPIGTGPFRAASRTPDAWTFERWEGSPRGVPAVSRAGLSFLADDRTQEVMLASGETDIALFISGPFLHDRALRHFQRKSGVVYVILNVRGQLSELQRQAFAASIDREEIEKKIYKGMSAEYASVVARQVAGSNVALAHRYDPAFARDIFRRVPLGAPIEIATFPGPAEAAAVLIQAHLGEAGVKALVRKYAEQRYLAPDGPLRSGRFDAAIFGEYFSPDPDLLATWGCGARPPAGGNFARLCDPEFDRFAASGETSQALATLARDAAVVPLVSSVMFAGLSSRVRGAANARDLVPMVYACTEWAIA